MSREYNTGFRAWLAEKLNPAQPSIATLEPYASPESIVDYEHAYRDIEIIHRAVELIINACVDIPLVVTGGTPAARVHKVLNVRPNPFEDRVRLYRRAFLDFILDGNAFFYHDRENHHIYLLPANDVEVVPDTKTFVSHYNYLITNQQSNNIFSYSKRTKHSEGIRFDSHEIIHVMSENDQSIFRGVSRLKSILRLIELYYYMIDFQRQFFKNNAIPGFVLSTENILSQKIKDRLLESWRSSYTTLFNNARNPAILDGGLKIDPFSAVKFSELDFESSIERIQQDMAKAIGVPYVLLKSGNNANITSNQKLFYLHTVIPILNQFTSAFMHHFNNGIMIKPDKLSVPALRPDEKTQSAYFATLVNTGIIKPNEARIGLGYSESEEEHMNEIRIPRNITGSATNATLGGRPPNQESDTPDDEGNSDE